MELGPLFDWAGEAAVRVLKHYGQSGLADQLKNFMNSDPTLKLLASSWRGAKYP